ncbi:mucin-2-like [Mytilus edulis]|uniref:mucin-2-like n=1 Tax=Mytilus edulis TaxID=6550 RepID=UPI0039EE70B8
MDRLLTFIIFVTLLSYCEPWFFDGVLDHGNVQRCPQSIPRDNFLYALNDTCIQLIREEHSWNDARRYCTKHHGDLVVIQDMAKQQYIMNALKTSGWVKNGIWIGGTDREREGHWKWVNGQKMTWGNWEKGQGPGNSGFLFSSGRWEDCTVIRRDDGYKWHDYACNLPSYHFGSICEYNFIPTTTHRPTTQTSTTPAPTTQSSTTPSPMSQSTTTPAPTTQSSTTPAPMTQSTTTPAPTTQSSTTPAPTTQSTTTPAPTTQTSTTPAPTTQSTTTPAPTTQTSTTPAPTTQSSTTPAPTTQSSTTPAPTTKSTTTPAPTTQSSTTPEPTTQTTTKPAPTTRSSTKPVLSTQIPTSKLPTTQPLATTLATTQKSTTPVPTTQISTTTIPTTKSTKPPAQTINLVTTSRTPLKTQILRTTKAKSTLFSTPIPTMKVTKAAPTTTQEIKETTTSPENPLPTQLVNNQGGLLRRSDNGNKPTNKSSTGYIIGGVCAAVVVAGIIVAVFVIRRRRLSSNDANRTVHGAENPMYSVMYDDASVPPVGADIQINDMYEPTKYFANGESMS